MAEKAPEAVEEETVSTDVSGPVASGKKVKQTSFDVYNKDNSLVRTYSVEQHGENAENLAGEYAKKIDGSVK